MFHTDCPARDVVDHVTSRWGIWVLISLRSNDLRFYELRDSIQGISEKMLAQTLRALVKDGLVWREVEPTTPPQVTYGLTEFGQDDRRAADGFVRPDHTAATAAQPGIVR